MKELTVKNFCAGYGGRYVVEDVSFTVHGGTVLGILGANGCGKTTLLRGLCGLLPHRGDRILDGTSLSHMNAKQLSRRCAYIPQRSGIGIDVSVLDVVLMGFNPRLGIFEHPDDRMRARALEVLRSVGLAERANDNYQTLSEGQKQLCVFARALAGEAELFLFDEPESALDFHFRHRMLSAIQKYTKEGQKAAVVTLHDPMLALRFCDEILLLDKGRTAGSFRPCTDPETVIESHLSRIYGPVYVKRIPDPAGRSHLILLKPTEEPF